MRRGGGHATRAENRSGAGSSKGLTPAAAGTAIRDAVEANRVEFHLQPIVSLPQRKVRHYEALARLRMADGELVPAGDFLDLAEAAGLMPRIDNLMVFRCVKVVRRLIVEESRYRAVLQYFRRQPLRMPNFSPSSLNSWPPTGQSLRRWFSNSRQAAYRSLGPIESESLAALMGWGFRFLLGSRQRSQIRATRPRRPWLSLHQGGGEPVARPASRRCGRHSRGGFVGSDVAVRH